MSFVDKLAALRRLLGIDSSLDSVRAIATMNVAMGITAHWRRRKDSMAAITPLNGLGMLASMTRELPQYLVAGA